MTYSLSRSELSPDRQGQASSGLVVSPWPPPFGLFEQQLLSRSRCSVPAAGGSNAERTLACLPRGSRRPSGSFQLSQVCRRDMVHQSCQFRLPAAPWTLAWPHGPLDLSSPPSDYPPRTGPIVILHTYTLVLCRTRRPQDRPDTVHPHPLRLSRDRATKVNLV